jgi:phosphoglucosamine mutase
MDAVPTASGRTGAVEDRSAAALAAWDDAVAELDLQLPSRRLVVDLAHGAATRMGARLEALWPGPLHVVGDGSGIVNDGVGSEHLDHLGAAVVRHGAWAGLAVDGDGDRCRLVDETGRAVPGDAVTWLLARALQVEGLAVTVMSTTALEAQLPGVRVVRTPVGDKHLMAAMAEHGLPLGAEESGHVLFGDYPAGDGLVAGLRALAAVGERPMSEALAPFTPFPRRLGKVRVASRPALETVGPVQQSVEAAEGRLGHHGRVFLRYSGTEPVLRILVEGTEAAAVSAAYDEVHAAVVGAMT